MFITKRFVLAVMLRVCTHRERQRVGATNYPFVKLMEIAESVHTGRVRQTRARVVFNRQDFKLL